MEKIEVTWGNTLRVWWSFMWRVGTFPVSIWVLKKILNKQYKTFSVALINEPNDAGSPASAITPAAHSVRPTRHPES